MEYALTVWDPHSEKLRNRIEQVQDKSVWWICNQWHWNESPTSMAEKLELQTLAVRRRIDLLKCRMICSMGTSFLMMRQSADNIAQM